MKAEEEKEEEGEEDEKEGAKEDGLEDSLPNPGGTERGLEEDKFVEEEGKEISPFSSSSRILSFIS